MGEALALRLKYVLTNMYFVWASQDKRPKVNGHHRPDFRIWTCVKHVQTTASSAGLRSLEIKRAIKKDVLTQLFLCISLRCRE